MSVVEGNATMSIGDAPLDHETKQAGQWVVTCKPIRWAAGGTKSCIWHWTLPVRSRRLRGGRRRTIIVPEGSPATTLVRLCICTGITRGWQLQRH